MQFMESNAQAGARASWGIRLKQLVECCPSPMHSVFGYGVFGAERGLAASGIGKAIEDIRSGRSEVPD